MTTTWKLGLVLALTLGHCVSEGKSEELDEAARQEIWDRTQKRIMDGVNSFLKPMSKDLMRIVYKSNITQKCSTDLTRIMVGLRNLKPWAIQMLDATGKPGAGITAGSFTFPGNYDQCLDIAAQSDSRDRKLIFRGQYCMVLINGHRPPRAVLNELHQRFYSKYKKFPNLNQVLLYDDLPMLSNFFGLRLGVCTPSTCSKDDINRLLKSLGDAIELKAKVLDCSVVTKFAPSRLQIASITVLLFFVFLVITGTFLDWYRKKKGFKFNGICGRIALCFSAISNTEKIFNLKDPSKIPCLHGIRFISMTWVILGHAYFTFTLGFFSSMTELLKWNEQFFFEGVVGGLLSMETFFFLAGLLLSYVVIDNVCVKKKSFNIQMYAVHRFLRLLPAYGFTIICVFIISLFIEGPIAGAVKKDFLNGCYNNWWRNILFINNFFPFTEMCILHTWYLSVDVQLYFFCLIILLPMMKWPKVGLVINFLAVAASAITLGLVTHFNHYPTRTVFSRTFREMWNFMDDIYTAPYTYLGSYCIGIFIGYVIATKPKIEIKPIFQVIGWTISVCCNLTVVYVLHFWTHESPFYTSVLYSSLSRVGWTAGVGWVVFMCYYGYGGWINKFLSCKIWIPFSRLTFTAYLFHPLVYSVFAGNLREQMYPSHYMMVWIYLGTLVITYSVAYCASLLVESPFMALEKILLGSFQKKKNNNNREDIPQDGITKEHTNGCTLTEKVSTIYSSPSVVNNERFSYKL